MEKLVHNLTENNNERIDKLLSKLYPSYTRSFFQNLLKDESVFVNQKPVKSSYKPVIGDEICVILPELKETPIIAENIPLDILYEDRDLLIVNKPKGMVVHPAAGHDSHTLVNALLYHCKDSLSGINGEIRPGIVHRIDRDTTGSLIVCKNDIAHNHIAKQIKEHTVKRIYVGIVTGVVKEDEGTIHAAIGRSQKDRKKMAIDEVSGRDAITHYKVISRSERYTYMQFQLETGRTHQIRVHMASIGHPLLGDEVYGKAVKNLKGQTLHAQTIGFIHPTTGEYLEFKAPLPKYFEEKLRKLKLKNE
ncbi:RluA family pseudouridine synthase [Eubacterium oxidoreducens]|uniref:Pseudouridine synthase n=1 Tax=Eubacterium oxidoreducens TaxID=1732 RepID=A0A1G6ALM2_EUBOX|nr:RluA family pseudouridine synthase [Eubacterium oxidoreducens]SDB09304.1 23S rRNA pseudouridine1911/1915/1917 synthase [Eubacterium oxidoreducens]